MQQFFTDASPDDILALIAVLIVLVLACLSCIAVLTYLAVKHKRNKTRKQIYHYKQKKKIAIGEMSMTQLDDDDMQSLFHNNHHDNDDCASISLGSNIIKTRRNSHSAHYDFAPLYVDNESSNVGKKLRRMSSAKLIREKVRRASTHATRANYKKELNRRQSAQQLSPNNMNRNRRSSHSSKSTGAAYNSYRHAPGNGNNGHITPGGQISSGVQLQNNKTSVESSAVHPALSDIVSQQVGNQHLHHPNNNFVIMPVRVPGQQQNMLEFKNKSSVSLVEQVIIEEEDEMSDDLESVISDLCSVSHKPGIIDKLYIDDNHGNQHFEYKNSDEIVSSSSSSSDYMNRNSKHKNASEISPLKEDKEDDMFEVDLKHLPSASYAHININSDGDSDVSDLSMQEHSSVSRSLMI